LQLTLALFVAWICTDHTHNALAPNYLAVTANFLDRSRNLHFILLKLQVCLTPAAQEYSDLNYFALKTMRARLKSYGVISTVTLSPGRMRM
jgi:hypothetical protein